MLILSRRAALQTFAAALASAANASGLAVPGASSWARGVRSRARLIAGGSEGEVRLAGLEIDLEEGFKTYWRQAGDAGLPPAFDWSGSRNVAAVEVLWPAPARLDDPGGVSYGYHGRVVLPLRVRPRRAEQPAGLALALEYGVCKDICIPVRAELALDLPAASGPQPQAIRDALARVPVKSPLGADGPVSILELAPIPPSGGRRFGVRVRAPAAPEPQLFVEAPDRWYLAAGRLEPRPSADPSSGTFPVEILERPKDATGPVDLRLTLVSGERAVETEVRLDADALAR